MAIKLPTAFDAQISSAMLATLGAAPGSTYLALANTLGATESANRMIAATLQSTPAGLADVVAGNLGLTGDAATAGKAYLTTVTFAGAQAGWGANLNTTLSLFSGLQSHATYGSAASAYVSKVNNALIYSLDSANDSIDMAVLREAVVGSGSGEGINFELTSDEDIPALTAFNDVITATSATYDADDDRIIDGSTTDNDVLNFAATSSPLLDVTNIENINIDWQAFGTPTIDLADVQGATVRLTSTKNGYFGNANFDNVGDNNISVGAGVTRTLTVDGIEDATVTATVAETIDIGSGAAADGLITVNAGAAETVEVNSGDDLIITALAADNIDLLGGTYDTLSLTLGVDADVLATGAADSVVTINSDADITVTIEAASAFEELVVAGTGVVDLEIADFDEVDGITVTNTNGTVIVAEAIETADLTGVSANEIRFEVEGAGGDVLTIASGQSFVFEDAEATAGDTITFQTDADDDSGADSVSITLEDEQGAPFIFDTADQEVELVTITIDPNADFDDETAFTIAGLQGNAAADHVFTIISADADVEVTITAADASVINATGVQGEFTLTSQTNNEELSILGAVGATTVAFAGTTADSYFTGDSDDGDTVTFITTTGSAAAMLGDGDNTVTANSAIQGTGVLFVSAGSGDDVVSATGITTGAAQLELGDGDNEITLGTNLAAGAVINITTGSGDDELTMDGDAADSAEITINLGTGTNRLILADDADLTGYTMSLTGVSEIELAAGDIGAEVRSSFLDGQAIRILSSGAAGVPTALLGVELQAADSSFDGSDLIISDSIASAVLGLDIDVTTAGTDYTIVGSEGSDSITTGTGDDTITGGTGADAITLGTGTDTVVMADDDGQAIGTVTAPGATLADADTIAFTGDTITNFTSGTDKFDVEETFTSIAATTDKTAVTLGVGDGQAAFVIGILDLTTGLFTVDAAAGTDLLVVYDADGTAGTTDVEGVVFLGITTIALADFV